jgi:hypothetical protein
MAQRPYWQTIFLILALMSSELFAQSVDYCSLRFPLAFQIDAGAISPLIYGRIFEDDGGVQTSAPGADMAVRAQLGLGPVSSDPRDNANWTWVDATFNLQEGNDDEYQATLIAPSVAGDPFFSYTYRFSINSGQSFDYCDLDGAGSNSGLTFDPLLLGVLSVRSEILFSSGFEE